MSNSIKSPLGGSPDQSTELCSSCGSSCSSFCSDSLPSSVCCRVNVLRMIQMEVSKLQASFCEDVCVLECKYAQMYKPYYHKRFLFISGAIEPTNEDISLSDMKTCSKDDLEITNAEENHNVNGNTDCYIKGIPDFWLTVMKNVEILREKIKAHDELILKHLIDIRDQFHQDSNIYMLEFHFEPNEYFHNTILTKQYKINFNVDESSPFCYEGPVMCNSKGCLINWKKGMDVTTKVITVREKNKSRRSLENVTKIVTNDSFFNFFNPPFVSGESFEIDEESEEILTADLELALYFREKIIPRAVLFFTGEACSDSQFDQEEEEEGEEETDEETEEEETDEEVEEEEIDEEMEEEVDVEEEVEFEYDEEIDEEEYDEEVEVVEYEYDEEVEEEVNTEVLS